MQQTMQSVQEASKVNVESLAAVDKLAIIEESNQESLEFVRHRLQSDLKNLRKKIDRLNQFKAQSDRNLRMIVNSNLQIRFKKVG